MIIRPPKIEPEELPPTAFVYSVPLMGRTLPATEPDPIETARRAQFEEARRTGHWLPWFTDVPPQQEEFFALHGFPRVLRDAAVEPLRRLYPPPVCRRMLADPQRAEVVSGLFSPWLPWILPLLDLSVDLRDAEPWSDKKLLGDLQSHDGWADLPGFFGPIESRETPLGSDCRLPRASL
jgi:hypothetical protein